MKFRGRELVHMHTQAWKHGMGVVDKIFVCFWAGMMVHGMVTGQVLGIVCGVFGLIWSFGDAIGDVGRKELQRTQDLGLDHMTQALGELAKTHPNLASTIMRSYTRKLVKDSLIFSEAEKTKLLPESAP